MLLQHGADVRGVPFSDVLLTWKPALIRLFLDRGADVLTDHPFAIAFGGKVRTALRPFVEYRKLHPELSKELQGQLNRACGTFLGKAISNGSAFSFGLGQTPGILDRVFTIETTQNRMELQWRTPPQVVNLRY